MSNLIVRMLDGREVSGDTVLMDQRGYGKWARRHDELPANEDPGTFSLYMAWRFYQRMTGEDIDLDTFLEQATDLDTDDGGPIGDPTTPATPNASP